LHFYSTSKDIKITFFQLGMTQLQLKQRTESLQNAESSLAEMTAKLRMIEENAEKESDRVNINDVATLQKYFLNSKFDKAMV
jgi:hypothetical protein